MFLHFRRRGVRQKCKSICSVEPATKTITVRRRPNYEILTDHNIPSDIIGHTYFADIDSEKKKTLSSIKCGRTRIVICMDVFGLGEYQGYFHRV